MATGQPSLFHGRGSERRETNHIACSIDVRHGSLKPLVHGQFSANPDRQAGRVQVEQIGVHLPPNGIQKRVSMNSLTALKICNDSPPRVALYVYDLFAQPEDRALA